MEGVHLKNPERSGVDRLVEFDQFQCADRVFSRRLGDLRRDQVRTQNVHVVDPLHHSSFQEIFHVGLQIQLVVIKTVQGDYILQIGPRWFGRVRRVRRVRHRTVPNKPKCSLDHKTIHKGTVMRILIL